MLHSWCNCILSNRIKENSLPGMPLGITMSSKGTTTTKKKKQKQKQKQKTNEELYHLRMWM